MRNAESQVPSQTQRMGASVLHTFMLKSTALGQPPFCTNQQVGMEANPPPAPTPRALEASECLKH